MVPDDAASATGDSIPCGDAGVLCGCAVEGCSSVAVIMIAIQRQRGGGVGYLFCSQVWCFMDSLDNDVLYSLVSRFLTLSSVVLLSAEFLPSHFA